MKTEIEKLAMTEYPEYWIDEPYSHAHCPDQIDINKSKREAFIEGATCFVNLLKENLSISISDETIIDYGNSSKSITVSLYLGEDKLSDSTISI